MDMQQGGCRCHHHKVMPALVILFGLVFLFEAFGWVSAYFTSVVWPILVIIGGCAKLMGHRCKCCSVDAPGMAK